MNRHEQMLAPAAPDHFINFILKSIPVISVETYRSLHFNGNNGVYKIPALLFFIVSRYAHAGVWPDSTTSPKDSLRKLQLNEIGITASRIPESVLKSPVSIELLDARQFDCRINPLISTPLKISKAFNC